MRPRHFIMFCVAALAAVCCLTGCAQPVGSVAFMGDSNLWIGGEDCSVPKSWVYNVTRELKPDTVKNYSRSGATWTVSANTRHDTQFYSELLHPDNVVMNQLLRMKADVDSLRFPAPELIIIGAGTNDAWFSDRLPGIFDNDGEYSLSKSVSDVVKDIKQTWPDCRVIVVTPPPATKFDGSKLTQVSEIIDMAASGQGAEVIRLDQDKSFDPDPKNGYTTDGVHTTPLGAMAIAGIIIKRMHKL